MRERIKRTILEAAGRLGIKVKEIILFGSRAKEEKTESDWDLLVIVESEKDKDLKEVWFTLYSALHDAIPGQSFDLIVQGKERFDEEKKIVNTIANEALREGVRL